MSKDSITLEKSKKFARRIVVIIDIDYKNHKEQTNI